ncbi:MAG: hypothetical protein AB2L20_07725 [Mangrovibacterium sp.]|jgi:hypothetical protein
MPNGNRLHEVKTDLYRAAFMEMDVFSLEYSDTKIMVSLPDSVIDVYYGKLDE